jgi:hypothetical protein
MMFEIRLIRPEDKKLTSEWYKRQGVQEPPDTQVPKDTTFVVTLDGVPIVQASLFITNVDFAILEWLIGNPDFKGAVRILAIKMIGKHIREFATSLGYSRVFGMTPHEKIKDHYEKHFGMFVLKQVYVMTTEENRNG